MLSFVLGVACRFELISQMPSKITRLVMSRNPVESTLGSVPFHAPSTFTFNSLDFFFLFDTFDSMEKVQYDLCQNISLNMLNLESYDSESSRTTKLL